MSYVDGYVIPVKTAQKEHYLAMAKACAIIFKDHSAVRVVENWGDDVPEGKLTSFPFAVKCEADETVVFSWICWPSKAARDSGMKSAMADERMQQWAPNALPFDGKRMIFGGFETLVDE